MKYMSRYTSCLKNECRVDTAHRWTAGKAVLVGDAHPTNSRRGGIYPALGRDESRPYLPRSCRDRNTQCPRQTLKDPNDKQDGFTLIEVLVVVVILSILAALIVPKIMDRPDEARVVAAKSDIRAVTSALKLYRLDNGVYPSTEQGLQALVKKPETGEVPRNWKGSGYLDRLPKDPWKNEYQYLNPGLHSDIDIFSLGADGQPGGEGVNADVGSWNLDL